MSDARRQVTGSSPDFVPPRRLRHHHVQSIYPSLPLRRRGVERRATSLRQASRELLVDCGDGVRLLALVATQAESGRPPSDRLAVLLHGWEGSANSLYLLSLGQQLLRCRLRRRASQPARSRRQPSPEPGIFHSCRIAEVVGAVHELQRHQPGQAAGARRVSRSAAISACGSAPARPRRASTSRASSRCARCSIPSTRCTRLESGWALYREYFVWKWRRSLRKKQQAWPDVYHSLDDILELGNLTDMTDRLACRLRRISVAAGVPARLRAGRPGARTAGGIARGARPHHRRGRRPDHPRSRPRADRAAAGAGGHADASRRALRLLRRRGRADLGRAARSWPTFEAG